MKTIRSLVYVLLCSSTLITFSFTADKTDNQLPTACPTSPVHKKNQTNVDHATSPIQKDKENQAIVEHGTTPINAAATVIVFSGSKTTKMGLGMFPSYPSFDRLDGAYRTLSSTFSADELAALQSSERKQALAHLNPNTSQIFDCNTTPVRVTPSPRK